MAPYCTPQIIIKSMIAHKYEKYYYSYGKINATQMYTLMGEKKCTAKINLQ